jgi:hypothetical protein
MNVTPLAKHDALATISIRFLSGLVGKLMHKNLFEGEGTLAEIFGKIVIPNLMIREVRNTTCTVLLHYCTFYASVTTNQHVSILSYYA